MLAREIAETLRREAESAGDMTAVAVAHRILGLTRLFQADFVEANAHLQEALRIYDPQRDGDGKFRYGQDTRAGATTYLAQLHWVLGICGRAWELFDEAVKRAIESEHPPTLAQTYQFKSLCEIFRGDAEAARNAGDTVVELGRANGMEIYMAWGALSSCWASTRLGDDVSKLRQALAAYAKQGNKAYVPLYQGLLAEIETEGVGTEAALARMDEALALAAETGERWTDAFLHRIRGHIFLKRDPANTALAEEAFLTAIAIAQEQKARSFELSAALSLAKLYQATGRAADAYAVLAPALAGFSPTPEFPEIAEAQTLLGTLGQSDDVKAATASRRRQAQLQISYANALIATRGHGALETTAAFARARELTAGIEDAIEGLSALYGLWAGSLVRGELAPMCEAADAFLREAEKRSISPEAGVAHRIYALTRWYQGDYANARHHLERALALLDRERDRDLTFRFGQDQFAATEIFLALVLWPMGEVTKAARLAEAARNHATESGQIATVAYMHTWLGHLEAVSRNPARTIAHAEPLLALSREHGLELYSAWGALLSVLARAYLSAGETDLSELQRAQAAFDGLGTKICVPFYHGVLAEFELETAGVEAGLTRIDTALALAAETGQGWSDAFLHRMRGEILLKCDPANTAPAEEAFLTAIAIAQQQKAKSFELRAALALAKLYQSTGRSADAHAVLAPALEGFSPTPEFPEISEAQVLLEVLAHTDEVKNATASRQRRLKLQTSYGQAMMWAKGYGAEETKAAFARARDFAANIGNFAGRSAANYGHWANSHMRGEFNLARETAEIFLREAMNEGRMPEASTAQRMLGFTSLFQGNFTESRAHLEEALRIYDPGWNNDDKFRLSVEPGLAAMAYLAEVEWALGYVGRSRDLIDESVARSIEAAHVPTLANSYNVRAEHEMFRGEVDAAMEAGKVAFEYSREHQLGHYMPMATIFSGWARARTRQSRGQSAGNASSPRRSYRTRKPGLGADLPGSPC